MTYATGTSVTVESSQQEIGKTLARYKVDEYAFGAERGRALVLFRLSGMPIRVAVPLPQRPAEGAKRRSGNGRLVPLEKDWEQDVKEAWRALALLIKANLEACERGIVRPEQAFMAYLVAPDGSTLGDLVLPQYQAAIESGAPMSLLALPSGG